MRKPKVPLFLANPDGSYVLVVGGRSKGLATTSNDFGRALRRAHIFPRCYEVEELDGTRNTYWVR